MRYSLPILRSSRSVLAVLAMCAGLAGNFAAAGDANSRPNFQRTLFQWSGSPVEYDPESDAEIMTDRPDFTEASTTVGQGRLQMELGYTYVRDNDAGTVSSNHSYPELLVRTGLFQEWFELRVGMNFLSERSPNEDLLLSTKGGADDLYLGTKLALTPQAGLAPEMAIVLQATVPTGHDNFSSDQLMPGINWLYGWDLNDWLSLAGSTQANRAYDGTDHYYTELAQSATIGYTLTEKLGAYTECFAFFPSGANDGEVKPEYYFNGGFTYKVTPNFQLDWRAGLGLNSAANDFFCGSGFSVRF